MKSPIFDHKLRLKNRGGGGGGTSTPSSGGGYHYVGDASVDYPTDGFALEYVVLGAIIGVVTTTSTYGNGVIRAWPFVIGRTGVIDEIQIECSAGAGAGALSRLAIYDNASRTRLYPTTRVGDSGNFDLSTTGLKTALVSIPLSEGSMYWAAYTTNSAGPVIRSLAAGSTLAMFGSSKAAAPSILTYNHFIFNEAFNGLSDPFPPAGTGTLGASAVADSSVVPAVLIHFAT